MPGKLCTGVSTQMGFLPKESRAFSEGLLYRASGTLLGKPVTDNPHVSTTSAGAAWIAGWTVSDTAAPAGTVSQSSAPCVAVPTNTVVDT